jgi:hypothetical protein
MDRDQGQDVFDPIAKVEDVFQFVAFAEADGGDLHIGAIAPAERIYCSQLHLAIAGFGPEARHPFPEAAHVVGIVVERINQRKIQIGESLPALDFDLAPDVRSVLQCGFEAIDECFLFSGHRL